MQLIAYRMQLAHSFPDPEKSSQHPFPISSNPILILSIHLFLELPSGTFLTSCPTKTPYTPHPSPYVPNALPISFFLISLPKSICEKYRSCSFSFYEVFSSPLFLRPSQAQPIPGHSLAYAFPSTGETKYHTQTKQTKKYFPLCTQNYRCHETFPAVRWMFTE